MPELIPVLKREEIEKSIARVAETISADYQGKELVLIGVLKGAFVFLSDLARQITIPVKIDFLRAASYGCRTSSSGKIQLTKDIEVDIADKDVLIVEDIVDTGRTLAWLVDYLNTFNPKTVRICTMVDKRERRHSKVKVDYACHIVEEGFLVGYGLDYDEEYRNLPEIYHLKL